MAGTVALGVRRAFEQERGCVWHFCFRYALPLYDGLPDVALLIEALHRCKSYGTLLLSGLDVGTPIALWCDGSQALEAATVFSSSACLWRRTSEAGNLRKCSEINKIGDVCC